MPKFKFSNSAESTPEVTVLPHGHFVENTFTTSHTHMSFEYQFDKHSIGLPLLISGFGWLSPTDIEELIAFLKAAKKRAEKNASLYENE